MLAYLSHSLDPCLYCIVPRDGGYLHSMVIHSLLPRDVAVIERTSLCGEASPGNPCIKIIIRSLMPPMGDQRTDILYPLAERLWHGTPMCLSVCACMRTCLCVCMHTLV